MVTFQNDNKDAQDTGYEHNRLLGPAEIVRYDINDTYVTPVTQVS